MAPDICQHKFRNDGVFQVRIFISDRYIISSMKIKFCKMQALGNDFMVVENVRQKLTLTRDLIKHWADRRHGVGFDQLLLLEAATDAKADFIYRIFNADGTEVEQCGNGARCVARFAFEQQLSVKKQLLLQTQQGLLSTELIKPDWVKVSLGLPDVKTTSQVLEIESHQVEIGILSVGNPHAIIQVEDVAFAPVAELGPRIEKHLIFMTGVNVSFMQIIDRQQIKLRVWERGVGETPACGSGASAAVVMGQARGELDANVEVVLPGGELQVSHRQQHPVYLIGPTMQVFLGEMTVGK